MHSNKSFRAELDKLGNEALNAVKTKLCTLKNKQYVLDRPLTLYINTDSPAGHIHMLNAKTVRLINNHIYIFAEDFDTESLNQPFGWDNLKPEDYWCSESNWYAEWEELFELFDKIIEH